MRGTVGGHHHPISSNFQHNHNSNMLKVVGASWVKTRISTMIVAGSLLLAIGSLYFIIMERPALSGKYCATAYWSTKSSYRTQYWGQQSNLSLVKEGAARICYSDSTMTNGWSQIEIETHPDYADDVQAFAAGMLEGALTYASIYNHWDNTINAYCSADNDTATFCDWLRETIEANVVHTKDRAAELSDTDHYWHQIHLYFRQLDGLHAGWEQGVERARADMELDAVELMLLNAAADIPDMRIYYENHVRTLAAEDWEFNAPPSKASMLLKFVCERSANEATANSVQLSDDMRPRQVLIGHSSDGSYSTMLRMLKRYKFHYHRSASSASSHRREVSGVSIAFTGYPGALASSDDFYMTEGKRSKLTVGGIRMQNANVRLWELVDVENGVLMAARVMAANRLAHDGYGWSRVMSRHPGFGTKQWMVVDVARMHDRSELLQRSDANDSVVMASHVSTDAFEMDEWTPISEQSGETMAGEWRTGLLWVVDQLPGRLHAEDVTARILGGDGDSFWTGNGVPYFNETRLISGIELDDDTLRQSNARVAQANITRLEDVAKVLRSRAYRGDLEGATSKTFGNIDMKLYAETSAARMEFHAKAGPLYFSAQHVGCSSTEDGGSGEATTGGVATDDKGEIDDGELSEIDLYAERRSVRDDMRAVAKLHSKHGPFRWSHTDLEDGHSGHPDVFDFGAVSPQWAWSMKQQN